MSIEPVAWIPARHWSVEMHIGPCEHLPHHVVENPPFGRRLKLPGLPARVPTMEPPCLA